MNLSGKDHLRADIVAGVRGPNPSQAVDGESDHKSASMEQTLLLWQIYRETLAMEDTVMERIQAVMAKLPPQARREVGLTIVPMVAAQAERFRQRLGSGAASVRKLE